MLDETALRRPDFHPGSPILLADGQRWTFPARTALTRGRSLNRDEPDGLVADYAATVAAVREASLGTRRLRTELALAIFLLCLNYDLTRDDLFALLCYAPGDPALAEVQEAFRRLALEHARPSRSSAVAAPEPRRAYHPSGGH
jgi:hypothetical protein